MRRHTLFSLCLGLAAAITGCAGPDAPANDAGGESGAGGKADGFDDTICPETVGINAGQGSQRRCFDTDNGQFVPTACCADLCDGAGWREQSNGVACAWVDEPGDPEAQLGQFAPRMCCELGDALACSRGQLQGGQCIDSESGEALDAGCCEQEPASGCHPALATELRACVHELGVDLESDPEAPPMTPLERLEVCANEGDLTGPIFDDLCAFDPDLPFCAVSFEAFDQQFVQPCFEEIRPEFDCVFGSTYRDIEGNADIAVIERDVLGLQDAQSLSATEQEQILIAVRQSAFDDVATLEDAFSFVDGAEINVQQLFDLTNGRSYTVYEYGAGDNGFGAFFEHGTTAIAARILDSDLYDDSQPPQFGCRIPAGPLGSACGSSADCPSGASCQGIIEDHPAFGTAGRCVDLSLGEGSPVSGMDCESHADCDPAQGLWCSGPQTQGFGFCRPGWMFGQFEDAASVPIPDNGVLERDIFVYGLATVPEDALIDLLVSHPDPTQLRITLRPVLQNEGTIATIWDGPVEATEHPELFLQGEPILHPGDESLNGRWTLVIEDLVPGEAGVLVGWGLRFSSRFD